MGQLWALVKEGAQRASKTAPTKAEITAIASEFLKGKTASFKIYKEDGTVQEEHFREPPTHGNLKADFDICVR
ncbi:DUF2188 domain-containing protein [Pseudomonas sp. ZS1P83]